MIELSKCPNCASEDRVTIAGKDFCMRCGTPSEDNAMISADPTQSNPTDASGSAPTAGVSRFNQQGQPAPSTPDPAASISSTTANPTTAGDPIVAPQQTSDPVATSQAVVADPAQASAPINPPLQPDPSSLPSLTQQDGAVDSAEHAKAVAESKINELSQKPPIQPSASNTLATDASSGANIISTLPGNDMASTPLDVHQPSVATQPNTTAAVPPPTPIDMSSKVNEAVNFAGTTPQPAPPASNTMPVKNPMTLKEDPGVLSDEALDALSNTEVEPPAVATQLPSMPPQAQNNFVPSPAPTLAPTMTSAQPATSTLNVQPLASEDGKSSNAKKALKPVGVVASIALVLAVGYYMWRVNYPNLAFKIASSKAGISASMPSYVPEGYKLNGNIQTSPGTVSYSLSSQGSKKIQISQSKTDWDSQALAENFVAPKADNYLALQAQGLTIYMMGNNQASWVNKGTWYRIESPSQPLTQEQVIRMATSL